MDNLKMDDDKIRFIRVPMCLKFMKIHDGKSINYLENLLRQFIYLIFWYLNFHIYRNLPKNPIFEGS